MTTMQIIVTIIILAMLAGAANAATHRCETDPQRVCADAGYAMPPLSASMAPRSECV